MMKIVERMFEGPVDVVGDIHGQVDALRDLLSALKYTADGSHPDGRKLVFVGDLVDRGPDSPGVVEQVMDMVRAGNAQCVLGNHELNIVRDSRKLDNTWYFGEAASRANGQRIATAAERTVIAEFFNSLPLALERDDLRVVHACWHAESIRRLQENGSDGTELAAGYANFREETERHLKLNGIYAQYEDEKCRFGEFIYYGDNDPLQHWPDDRLLPGYAAVDEARQMGNPIAVLTSGQERAARRTYAAGGRFRFVDRVPWWNEHQDEKPVIIGHYWRLFDFGIAKPPRSAGIDVFSGAGPAEWLGARKNVYCVDFSVAGRSARFSDDVCRLAAVRWPETTVVFDNGEEIQTRYHG